MKKAVLLLTSILFISCSAESASEELATCEVQVWGMSKNNTTGEFRYWVEYGKDEDQTTEVEVNESTYTYYSELFADNDDFNDCWEGVK